MGVGWRDNLLDHLTDTVQTLMMIPINPALILHLAIEKPNNFSACWSRASERNAETKTNDLESELGIVEINDENCYLRLNNKVVNVTVRVINGNSF